MSVRILMDVHVRAEITNGLKNRRVDVLTAQEDGSAELPDSLLLDRASAVQPGHRPPCRSCGKTTTWERVLGRRLRPSVAHHGWSMCR
jgi:hypothetical protein